MSENKELSCHVSVTSSSEAPSLEAGVELWVSSGAPCTCAPDSRCS